MILDASVLISFDRHERPSTTIIEALEQRGSAIHTTEPVVAQVWRHGAQQVRLARLLHALVIHPFEEGRSVGRLLGASGTSDVVDAHLVHLAVQLGEPVLTGDPDDLRRIGASFGDHAPTIYAWP